MLCFPAFSSICFPILSKYAFPFCACIILREHKPFKPLRMNFFPLWFTQPWFFSLNTNGKCRHPEDWSCDKSWKPQGCVCLFVCARKSCVWHFVTPWTVTRQAPLSMEFSRQEYWSRLSLPPPQDLPDTRWNLSLLHWQADSLPLSHSLSGSATRLGSLLILSRL